MLFTIHTALVAHHSKPLNALLSGPMLEAREGCAWLEDIDEHTFSRFGQFLYTTDYTAADPGTLPSSSDVPMENSNPSNGCADEARLQNDAPHMDEALDVAIPVELNEEPEMAAPDPSDDTGREGGVWDFGWDSRRHVKKKGRSRDAGGGPAITKSKKSLLWEKFERLSYPHPGPTFKPRKNRDAGEDFTAVFLGHARLYVFADRYDIESLRSLCLYKLH